MARPTSFPARASLQRLRGLLQRGQRTAFVFSGGGNLGAVQVGMMRALVEAGITPDVIVGCSVGAINGAAFAADPGVRGLLRLERIWNRLADGDPDLMPSRLLPLAAQVARRGEAVHDQAILASLISEELPVRTFEELAIGFACVATDLDDAEEWWFDSGPLLPALLASSALPAVYPPVEIDGRRYIDGGVVREAPVAQAVAMGARRVYLLHVGHLSEARSRSVDRPIDAALRAYWLARYRRFEDELESLDDHSVTLIRLPAGEIPDLRFDDFSEGRTLVARAHEASAAFLATEPGA